MTACFFSKIVSLFIKHMLPNVKKSCFADDDFCVNNFLLVEFFLSLSWRFSTWAILRSLSIDTSFLLFGLRFFFFLSLLFSASYAPILPQQFLQSYNIVESNHYLLYSQLHKQNHNLKFFQQHLRYLSPPKTEDIFKMRELANSPFAFCDITNNHLREKVTHLINLLNYTITTLS